MTVAQANDQTIMTGHPLATPVVTAATTPEVKTETVTPAPSPKVSTLLGSPVSAQPGPDKAELLLSDPNKFAEAIRQDVLGAVKSEENRKLAVNKMWNEFYQENSDLKDVEEHVNSVLRDNYTDWEKLSVNEAKKKLADEARRRLDVLKKKFGMKEEKLQSAPAATLPSSGESAPVIEKQTKPTNFVDEMLEIRRKKRKS